MENKEQSTSWEDFKKWWVKQDGGTRLDNLKLFSHHPLISPMMYMNNSVIAVIDIKSMGYLYFSPNYPDFTGWDMRDVMEGGVQFSFSLIHPNDQTGLTAFSELVNAYFQKLPDSQKGHFASFWDYRIRDPKGGYFKVLQQDCALKYDAQGQMEEKLLFVSKIDGVISNESQHLRLTNGTENLFYKYDHSLKTAVQLPLLTEREMEIVKLTAKSRTAKDIADQLHLSPETVRAHSRNIREKLQVNDALEMVNVLRVWGFI